MEHSGSESLMALIPLGISLAIGLFMLISMWRVFTKAGCPGWGALIPIFNTYLMLKIAGKPGWWLILLFIPIVGFVISLIMLYGVAQNFGKGIGYMLGFIFLPIIFFPLLAFGDAEYQASPAW